MDQQQTFLVFGATGQTGQHFTSIALQGGHRVRALVRTPGKLDHKSPNLEIHQGTITDPPDLDPLLEGVDTVVCMLGDAPLQRTSRINTAFVAQLIPAMRRTGVSRFLYQAGGLSTAPGQRLSLALWTIRNTVARSNIGQHKDNEAVMRYLTDDAMDIGCRVVATSERSPTIWFDPLMGQGSGRQRRCPTRGFRPFATDDQPNRVMVSKIINVDEV